MQPPVARDAKSIDDQKAIEESEAVTKMARGQETVRIDGLTDDATIKKYFGDRFVKYDYTIGGHRFVGVVVPMKLAKDFNSGDK